MLEGPLGGASAQADHEHVGELRVPEPRHVEILGVLEMTPQRVLH